MGEHKMYSIYLFDLDGTVTDPGIGITDSVMYALAKYGIEVEDRSQLYRFIGPPLVESFQEFYGFDKARAEQAVAYYREYYRDKGIYGCYVYDGIEMLLQTLRAKGCHILLATSKPEPFARQILEHFNLSQYFDVIAGSDFENVRNTKGKVIAYAISTFANNKDMTEQKIQASAVMVGDRFHDVKGANENGIPTIGVTFGYGSKEELVEAGAAYIAATPQDIAEPVQVR